MPFLFLSLSLPLSLFFIRLSNGMNQTLCENRIERVQDQCLVYRVHFFDLDSMGEELERVLTEAEQFENVV